MEEYDPGECDPQGTEPCFDGGGGSIPPPEPYSCEETNPPAWCQLGNKCDTGDEILDNTGVMEINEELIDNSNMDLPIDQRQEQGGWITQDPITDEYGFVLFPDDWQTTACGITPTQNWKNSIPDNTVAYTHTHPFYEGEDTTDPNVCGSDGSTSYSSGTNIWDIDFLNEMSSHLQDYSIKGYVLDGDNITTFSVLQGHIDTDERCGY